MRAKAALAAIAAVILAAAAGSSLGAQQQPVSILTFAQTYPLRSLDEGVDNAECLLGFTSLARYHRQGLLGFAARLSEPQLRRLESSGLVLPPMAERGEFLFNVSELDPDAADRRVSELEHSIGFSVDVRFHRKSFQGWGASLDWRQLALLDRQPDVSRVFREGTEDAIYLHGVDGDATFPRADALGRKYGFSVSWVYANIFGASLSNEQLAGLSSEPDVEAYIPGDLRYAFVNGPPYVNCLHASAQTRRDLANAFRHAHPGAVAHETGRILYARFAVYPQTGATRVTEHAVATFRVGAQATREVFWRRTDGRWLDLRPLGATICTNKVPQPVLQMWLFRPVSPRCYASS